MPRVLPLSPRLERFIYHHQLTKIWEKQVTIFSIDPFYPSLRTELLEPKHFRLYSFRITKSYRAIFVYCGDDDVEIIDINNHYRS
jgi:Txe/YoeB family toxin of Txe-Axe toxin-antitoxin module